MKIIAAVFTLLAILIPATVSTATPSNELAEIQEKIRSVAKVAETSCLSLRTKTGGWGSGVVVSEMGHVFTAAHAVGEIGDSVLAIAADGTRYRGVVLDIEKSIDVALVKLNSDRKWQPVALSNGAKNGDLLLAAGFAGGFEAGRGAPIRLGYCVDKNMNDKLVSNCRITAGDSGGGIFDLEGNLLGINISVDANSNCAFHIGVEAFLNFFPELEPSLAAHKVAAVTATAKVRS